MRRLEFERRRRGWSQAELGLRAGRSQPVIAVAEHGEASAETLEALARALRISQPCVLLREVRPEREPEELAAERRAAEHG